MFFFYFFLLWKQCQFHSLYQTIVFPFIRNGANTSSSSTHYCYCLPKKNIPFILYSCVYGILFVFDYWLSKVVWDVWIMHHITSVLVVLMSVQGDFCGTHAAAAAAETRWKPSKYLRIYTTKTMCISPSCFSGPFIYCLLFSGEMLRNLLFLGEPKIDSPSAEYTFHSFLCFIDVGCLVLLHF